MKRKQICMLNPIMSVTGKVFWNDRRRRLNLKKPVRELISDNDPESDDLNYEMEICLKKEVLLKRTEELINKGINPILLYFYKGGNNVC